MAKQNNQQSTKRDGRPSSAGKRKSSIAEYFSARKIANEIRRLKHVLFSLHGGVENAKRMASSMGPMGVSELARLLKAPETHERLKAIADAKFQRACRRAERKAQAVQVAAYVPSTEETALAQEFAKLTLATPKVKRERKPRKVVATVRAVVRKKTISTVSHFGRGRKLVVAAKKMVAKAGKRKKPPVAARSIRQVATAKKATPKMKVARKPARSVAKRTTRRATAAS